MRKKQFFLFLLLVTLFFGFYFLGKNNFFPINLKLFTPQKLAQTYPQLTPTPTPTPKPLTFSEMNSLYGPCIKLPTLMYHHVQDMETAIGKNQTSLTVDTTTFRQQMQYLKDKGYKSVYMSDVLNFFDAGVPIPGKGVLITFDDGYDDFAASAAPILREFGFVSTLFVSTGLMDNPGYLSWNTIKELTSAGDVVFANHTWSHRNVGANRVDVEREIKTADGQLEERGLNSPRLFAYPYGLESTWGKEILEGLGYKLAFTTRPGSVLCEKQRMELPRVRVGNSSLETYGL